MDCDPFIHAYVPSWDNFTLVFAIWGVETRDLSKRPFIFSCYIKICDNKPFVGRNILRSGKMDDLGKPFTLPCPEDEDLVLSTYDDPPTISSPHTYLSLLPTHCVVVSATIFSCLTLLHSLISVRCRITKSVSVARQYKRLSHRLHAYYHLPTADLETICYNAGFLTLHLLHSLSDVS